MFVCLCMTFLYRHLIASLNLAKFGQWKNKLNKARGAGHLASAIGFVTVIQMFDKLLQHLQRQQKQQHLTVATNKCNNHEQSVLQATYETHFRHSNYFNGQFIYLFGLWRLFVFPPTFSLNLPFKECFLSCLHLHEFPGILFCFCFGVLTWLKLRLNGFHVIYEEADFIFNGQKSSGRAKVKNVFVNDETTN